MRISEAAEIVLKSSARPMHARDISVAIEERKLFMFRTSDKVSVVSKALRQSEKFVKIAPGTFALR